MTSCDRLQTLLVPLRYLSRVHAKHSEAGVMYKSECSLQKVQITSWLFGTQSCDPHTLSVDRIRIDAGPTPNKILCI